MTLPTGTRLGPYKILSPLGAGGMGEMYRTWDNKARALKIPNFDPLRKNPRFHKLVAAGK
jgi:hypothetical protein